jgi:uncharacterized protein YcbK (DUF882 family)
VLAVHNAHTGEAGEVEYLDGNGRPDPQGLQALDNLFRCHYTDEQASIDPGLYALLDALRCSLGATDRPYELISGYRSPRYNKLLIARGRKVARNSYHLRGMAADVRLEGVSMATLHTTAVARKAGGVGRYGEFVHVDVGPVRYW